MHSVPCEKLCLLSGGYYGSGLFFHNRSLAAAFYCFKKSVCLFVDVVVDFNHSAKVKNMDNDRLLRGVVAGFKERWTCRGYMQSCGLRFV